MLDAEVHAFDAVQHVSHNPHYWCLAESLELAAAVVARSDDHERVAWCSSALRNAAATRSSTGIASTTWPRPLDEARDRRSA